ncbi:hypothetical protein U1Q18_007972 [Sarracenia purpurea var. burkii]
MVLLGARIKTSSGTGRVLGLKLPTESRFDIEFKDQRARIGASNGPSGMFPTKLRFDIKNQMLGLVLLAHIRIRMLGVGLLAQIEFLDMHWIQKIDQVLMGGKRWYGFGIVFRDKGKRPFSLESRLSFG